MQKLGTNAGFASPETQELRVGDVIYLEAVWHGDSRPRFDKSEDDRNLDDSASILCCDGFASEECRLVTVKDWTEDATHDIRDCLFQIVTKLNYGAAAEYKRTKRKKSLEKNEINQLHWRKEVEVRENSKLLKKVGEQLEHGATLQLLHLKSHKYLTLLSDFSASMQKDCRLLHCIPTGNEGSKFRVQPFYRGLRPFGEVISAGEVLALMSGELGLPWMLHFSEEPLLIQRQATSDGSFGEVTSVMHEVNISTRLETNHHAWKFRLFSRTPLFAQSVDGMINNRFNLGYGSVVTLQMPHHEGYLALSAHPFRDNEECKDKSPAGASLKSTDKMSPYLMPKKTVELLQNTISAKCMWVIERPKKTQGSEVHWDDEVCLRHLGSSSYLGVDFGEQPCLRQKTRTSSAPTGQSKSFFGGPPRNTSKNFFSPEMRLDSEQCRVVAVSSCDPALCIFRIEKLLELEARDDCVPAHKARFFLRNAGRCGPSSAGDASRTQEDFQRELVGPNFYLCCSTKVETPHDEVDCTPGSVRIGLGLCSNSPPESDSWLCELPPPALVRSVEQALSLRTMLESTLQACVQVILEVRHAEDDESVATSPAGAAASRRSQTTKALTSILHYDELRKKQAASLEQLLETLSGCLEFLSPFCEKGDDDDDEACPEGEGPAEDSDSDDGDDQDIHVDKVKQGIFRELKCTNAVVLVMEELWKIKPLTKRTSQANITFDNPKTLAPPGEESKDPTEEEDKEDIVSVIGDIYDMVFKVLTKSFYDNRQCELYIDKQGWVPQIVGRMAYGIGAERCFAALITNNPELLEKRICMDIIERFVLLVKDLGCDPDFLTLMQSCCSCTGVGGIVSKQELCLRALYFHGELAPETESKRFSENHRQLLLNFGTNVSADCDSFPELPEDLQAAAGTGDFMGAKIWKSGVLPDILVSWNYCAVEGHVWGLDQEFLYHSPRALGLETRELTDAYNRPVVTLRQLTHDLWWEETNRKSSYRNSTNARGSKFQNTPFTKRQREARKLLSKYAMQQLALFGEMALDRSMNVVEALEKEFSFELCICGVFDSRLPCMLRAHFVTLISRLYVNRQPHMNLNLPSMAREWQKQDVEVIDLPSLAHFQENEAGASSGVNKFILVEFAVRNHFFQLHGCQTLSDEGQNQLTKALLETMRLLVIFGFFPTIQRLHRVCGPILEVMDGRPDQLKHNRGSSVGSNATRDFTPTPSETEKAKSALKNSPEPLAPLKLSSVVPEPKGLQPALVNVSVQGQPFGGLGFHPPEMRYSTTLDGSTTVISCKARMAEIASEVLLVGTDYAISRLLRIFSKHHSVIKASALNTGCLPDTVVQEVVRDIAEDTKFAVDSISGLPFATTCMDLSMYDSEELFYASFRLLCNSCLHLKASLENAMEVSLLQRAEPGMTRQVVRLEQLLTSYEQWGVDNVFSTIGQKEADECIYLLVALRRALSEGGPDVDTEVPDTLAQEVMVAFGVQRVVLLAFNISVPPDVDFESGSISASADILFRVLRHCCELLAMLCRKHERNQKSLFRSVDKLVAHPWHRRLGVYSVIAEICRENMSLCEQMPESIVKGMVVGANKPGSRRFQVDVLEAVLACVAVNDEQRPVPRVKRILLEALTDRHCQENLLLLYNSDEERVRRRQLVANFSSLEALDLPLEMFRSYNTPEDAELIYHMSSLRLLIVLSVGRDPLAEAFVQSILSVQEAALSYIDLCTDESLIDSHMGVNLKTFFLQLMEAAYFDSSLRDDNYAASTLHAMVLSTICSEIEKYSCESRSDNVHVQLYIVQGIVKFFTSYIEYVYNPARAPRTVKKQVEKLRPLVENLHEFYSKSEVVAVRTSIARLPSNQKETPSFREDNDDKKGDKIDQLRILLHHVSPSIVFNGVSIQKEKTGLSDPSWNLMSRISLRQGTFNEGMNRMEERTSEELSREFHCFCVLLWKNERIKSLISDGYVKLVTSIQNVYQLTSPDDPSAAANPSEVRTNAIERKALLSQWVKMCLKALEGQASWDFVMLMMEVMCEYLYFAAGQPLGTSNLVDSGGIARLTALGGHEYEADSPFHQAQVEIAESGAVKLVVCTISLQPPGKVLLKVLELGVLMLLGGSTVIQDVWKNVLQAHDESDFFDALRNTQYGIVDSAKSFRRLKCTLADKGVMNVSKEEKEQLSKHTEMQRQMQLFNQLLTLLCENHNKWHQDYLRDQKDNSRPQDVLASTVDVMNRFCESDDGQEMDHGDLEVLNTFPVLLCEMLQGPCVENQEQIVGHTKVVEVFIRILGTRFSMVQKLEGIKQVEIPEVVQELKGKICLALNSLYEGHAAGDDALLKAVLTWVDPLVLKDRLRRNYNALHYRYLQTRKGGVFRGLDRLGAVVDGATGAILADSPKPGKRKAKGRGSDDMPDIEEVRSMLSEEDLCQQLLEPLELIKFIKAASLASDEFKEKIRPNMEVDERFLEMDSLKIESFLKDEKDYMKAYSFFETMVRSIEIALPSNGALAVYHFVVPLSCLYIAEQQRDKLLASVDLTTDEQKIIDFIDGVEDMTEQVWHTQRLSEWECNFGFTRTRPFNIFLCNEEQNLTRNNLCGLVIAVLISLSLLFSDPRDLDQQPGALLGLGAAEPPLGRRLRGGSTLSTYNSNSGLNESRGNTFGSGTGWQVAMFTMGLLYVILSAIALIVTVAVMRPSLRAANSTESQRRCFCNLGRVATFLFVLAGAVVTFLFIDPLVPLVWLALVAFLSPEEGGDSKLQGCVDEFWGGAAAAGRVLRTVMFTDMLFPRVTFFYLSVVGVLHDSFYFSLLLLEIVFLIPVMRGVLHAIFRPMRRLICMLALMTVIIYIFSMRSYLSYYTEYKHEECDTALRCFVYTFYRGTTFTDGLGDYLGRGTELPFRRVFYDLCYFVVVSILVFNMVTGIIIDTFGAIRDEEEFREDRLQNYCFISGLSRAQIDNAALKRGIQQGFKDHVENRQNKWDYMAFLFYVKNKDRNELNGTESGVLTLIQKKDHRWLPMGRALLIESMEESWGQSNGAGSPGNGGSASASTSSAAPGSDSAVAAGGTELEARLARLEAQQAQILKAVMKFGATSQPSFSNRSRGWDKDLPEQMPIFEGDSAQPGGSESMDKRWTVEEC